MAEIKTMSALFMDRSDPLGNSDDGHGRRALHVRSMSGLLPISYQAFTVDYPNATTEVISFRSSSLSGPVVATMTIVYTDSQKSFVSSLEVIYP